MWKIIKTLYSSSRLICNAYLCNHFLYVTLASEIEGDRVGCFHISALKSIYHSQFRNLFQETSKVALVKITYFCSEPKNLEIFSSSDNICVHLEAVKLNILFASCKNILWKLVNISFPRSRTSKLWTGTWLLVLCLCLLSWSNTRSSCGWQIKKDNSAESVKGWWRKKTKTMISIIG